MKCNYLGCFINPYTATLTFNVVDKIDNLVIKVNNEIKFNREYIDIDVEIVLNIAELNKPFNSLTIEETVTDVVETKSFNFSILNKTEETIMSNNLKEGSNLIPISTYFINYMGAQNKPTIDSDSVPQIPNSDVSQFFGVGISPDKYNNGFNDGFLIGVHAR